MPKSSPRRELGRDGRFVLDFLREDDTILPIWLVNLLVFARLSFLLKGSKPSASSADSFFRIFFSILLIKELSRFWRRLLRWLLGVPANELTDKFFFVWLRF